MNFGIYFSWGLAAGVQLWPSEVKKISIKSRNSGKLWDSFYERGLKVDRELVLFPKAMEKKS